MPASFYLFLHVSSVLLLTGGVFYSFAAPIETKKRLMILTGIASLLALIGGFGILAKNYSGLFPAWVIVKILAWLGLSAISGLAYRRREKLKLWVFLAVVCVLTAVAMAAFKPWF